MCRDPRSVRPAGRDDDPNRHRMRFPPAFTRDLPGKPALTIHAADEIVDVDDVCLQFDDQDSPEAGVPGENVDDSSLAIDGERDLGLEDPIREGAVEHPCDLLVEG